WVEHALMGGVGWFRLNQRTELGVVPIDIRMIQHPLENAKQKAGRFFIPLNVRFASTQFRAKRSRLARSLRLILLMSLLMVSIWAVTTQRAGNDGKQ
ncbi:hypothetical protein BOO36_18940, partial [Vibrio navarrensis]|nr:hypothetical protein [Vibrio navarrensis]